MPDRTRNFSIIAHIDHGKSTLADRFLQITGAVSEREFRDQMLDDMELERERGITIKSRAVAIDYGQYHLNLIDTPGHVDFSYEVSRSLAACEGAVLLVDAAQGVEAQTVANAYLAIKNDLEIIPVINKIDLPGARPDEVAEQMARALGMDGSDILHVSAKTGEGAEEVLRAVVERVPPPTGEPDGPLRALVFDSVYDSYRGVIVYVRVVDGKLSSGDRIRMMRAGTTYDVTELGVFAPKPEPRRELCAGEVGYVVSGIKRLQDVRVGDTLTVATKQAAEPLPGYQEAKPMVFCGIYPGEGTESEALRQGLEKLSLNDASFLFEPEHSAALGFGFRCGFLGLLHMEIVQERLARESDLSIIQTAPTVTYQIEKTDGTVIEVRSPSGVPEASKIREFREPIVRTQLILPSKYIGPIMKLCEDRQGRYRHTEYLSAERVILEYDLPMSELIFDFYDKLKSATRGYGTMDYEFKAFETGDLVKLDILVNGTHVDALSTICHKGDAKRRGRRYVELLRKAIPRHLFQVPIQAAIGANVIARENIAPLRKNVTAKCYGGDVTRKRKLLEKQKAGKRRMRSIGSVEVPQEAFLAVLSSRED